ncbi:MAG: YkgJ family cysteine cluster protein [Pseudoxanthomonas suwonensis]|nr:YkgJ family cysteine cluster protein [Pseudoxanthomonas suwonensis]
MSHPCLSCGACCASYRVAFHWSEADDAPNGHVPAALTGSLRMHERAMRGTDQPQPRCVALVGVIGLAAHCGIYPQRPSPCHQLLPSWESGRADAQCDRARIRHGLRPLQPHDWPTRHAFPDGDQANDALWSDGDGTQAA